MCDINKSFEKSKTKKQMGTIIEDDDDDDIYRPKKIGDRD